MANQKVRVTWEVAEDERFKRIIKTGTEIADSNYAHSVDAKVKGLAPDTWYYYCGRRN